jgi:hypothetical protein
VFHVGYFGELEQESTYVSCITVALGRLTVALTRLTITLGRLTLVFYL